MPAGISCEQTITLVNRQHIVITFSKYSERKQETKEQNTYPKKTKPEIRLIIIPNPDSNIRAHSFYTLKTRANRMDEKN